MMMMMMIMMMMMMMKVIVKFADGDGGGGGGARDPQFGNVTYSGGNGSGGVVIIKYPNTYSQAVSTTGSPTYTNSGGNHIYKWTGSGSITW